MSDQMANGKNDKIVKVETASVQPVEQIESLILTIRDKQVILDRDLARLYGVETRRLNEQVKRNMERFPEDFMFQLNKEEFENWKSQIATSNDEEDLKSQIATSSWGGARKLPYAFTENGIAMLSGILHSPMAIATNIHIMRAFNAMRHFIGSHAQMFQRIEVLERTQLSLVAFKEETNRNFAEVFNRAHDRFLCIDDTVYLVGASLKDLGKKWFGFSKMGVTTDELLSKM